MTTGIKLDFALRVQLKKILSIESVAGIGFKLPHQLPFEGCR